jgi:hypothetical protein
MLVQLFNHGTGSGDGPIDYVTADTGLYFDEAGKIIRDDQGKPKTYIREPLPQIIYGDPDLVKQLIDSSEYKHKYSSGVLSFAPEDGFLTPEKEAALIADFERVAFAGLDKDQYAILWVKHTHVGHEELHFVVPRLELSTGKSFNPFPPGYEKTFDPWRSLWNEKELWADPDDRQRTRLVSNLGHQGKLDANALRSGLPVAENPKALVTAYLVEGIKNGLITNRDTVIEALEEAGLEITRKGKDYISIRPELDSKPIRLKGVIYGENFNSGDINRTIGEEGKTRSGADREPDQSRITRLGGLVEEAVVKRAEYNRGRYKPKVGGITSEHSGNIEPTPEPSGDAESGIAQNMDKADADRVEPLSWYLCRELGGAAIEYAENFEQSRRDRTPNPNVNVIGEEGRKNQSDGMRRETEDLRPDRRERAILRRRIQNFESKIRELYDAARKTIDSSVVELIERFRGNAESSTETDRAFDQARASLNQASLELVGATERIGVIMENRADELEKFKLEINLCEYAANLGYKLIKEESSKNSKIMKHGDGDKIVVATDHDGHSIYFSVHDETSGGSIIDFVQKRRNLNLGQIRKALRAFAGMPVEEIKARGLKKPRPTGKDLQRVIMAYSKATSGIPLYLTKNRAIALEIINDTRFSGAVRVDANGNAVFPHYNEAGLCGYEIRGDNFKGFAAGGSKGLWFSSNLSQAKRLVITESGINALSHAQLKNDPEAAYISIAGSMNEHQPELIKKVFEKAAERGAEVVLAVDNDKAGQDFAATIGAVASENGLSFKSDVPKLNDWNAELIEQERREELYKAQSRNHAPER